jgi:hypothetical protein
MLTRMGQAIVGVAVLLGFLALLGFCGYVEGMQ